MKKSRLEIKPIRKNLSRVLDSARNGNPGMEIQNPCLSWESIIRT